jgi:hypothetical protein
MKRTLLLAVWLFAGGSAWAQFLDDFNGASILKDPKALDGWAFFTGDGSAVMDFQRSKGFASISVDATQDERNVWWALIKRRVSENMDLSRLRDPANALRIEARIRVSEAPRRVNLHFNTQRTTDFHTHLMEFDIPDTTHWHTISMTTHGFDVVPGDTVFGQLALMDWGLGRYRVDIDYIKADIVNTASVGPDKGVQVPYHPPISDPNIFAHVLVVTQDATIDMQYRDRNFNDWRASSNSQRTILLTIGGTQLAILRWDLHALAGKKVTDRGLLELTTYDVQRLARDVKDFGMVRVVEILGGDPNWNQQTVTANSFCLGRPIDTVLNSQMIIDVNVTPGPDGKTLATISRPVLQRMIDGRTFGLAIRPLGAIHASFYAMENHDERRSARLYLDVQE